MALREDGRFGLAATAVSSRVVADALREHRAVLSEGPWIYCGYAALPPVAGIHPPQAEVEGPVDNAFRLTPTYGFEAVRTVVTAGLRASRFAAILFWEVLHVLEVGGTWIDVDETARLDGTGLVEHDFLDREYFARCLQTEATLFHAATTVRTMRKHAPTLMAEHVADVGWTFGILTSGSSPRAAAMAAAILALDLPDVEVIFCGPRPAGAPSDDRVRAIDLDRPEPRGWITRKKNLIAQAARHENLCLLHDRYVITPEWADALKAYGPCFSFVTCPQVYYAGNGRQFPQRYPDYQLLDQHRGLGGAMRWSVYDSERVYHPEYDDFSETAFCCGGLYFAKRSLWNHVRQDEALYHCEWEDITFGLDCQRRGMPHRVNPFLTAESLAAHPLLLTRMHVLEAPAHTQRGRLHVTAEQETARTAAPHLFKPVVPASRTQYYESVRRRFNAIPGLADRHRLPASTVERCRGLADFWAAVERHVSGLPLATRSDIAQVAFFLSDTVYKWPAPQLLSWIRGRERSLADPGSLARYTTVVGWGTGAAFRDAHRAIGRDLAFVVDSNQAKWGTVVDGVGVRPPSELKACDPRTTAVVVFSCFLEQIEPLVKAQGAFAVLPVTRLVAAQRFRPLVDLVSYFQEVERYYPVIFEARAAEVAA